MNRNDPNFPHEEYAILSGLIAPGVARKYHDSSSVTKNVNDLVMADLKNMIRPSGVVLPRVMRKRIRLMEREKQKNEKMNEIELKQQQQIDGQGDNSTHDTLKQQQVSMTNLLDLDEEIEKTTLLERVSHWDAKRCHNKSPVSLLNNVLDTEDDDNEQDLKAHLPYDYEAPPHDPSLVFTAYQIEKKLSKANAALMEIQKQLIRGEEMYFQDTDAHGNIFKGWDAFIDSKAEHLGIANVDLGSGLTNLHHGASSSNVSSAPSRRMPADLRWFSSSLSSVEQTAASRQPSGNSNSERKRSLPSLLNRKISFSPSLPIQNSRLSTRTISSSNIATSETSQSSTPDESNVPVVDVDETEPITLNTSNHSQSADTSENVVTEPKEGSSNLPVKVEKNKVVDDSNQMDVEDEGKHTLKANLEDQEIPVIEKENIISSPAQTENEIKIEMTPETSAIETTEPKVEIPKEEEDSLMTTNVADPNNSNDEMENSEEKDVKDETKPTKGSNDDIDTTTIENEPASSSKSRRRSSENKSIDDVETSEEKDMKDEKETTKYNDDDIEMPSIQSEPTSSSKSRKQSSEKNSNDDVLQSEEKDEKESTESKKKEIDMTATQNEPGSTSKSRKRSSENRSSSPKKDTSTSSSKTPEPKTSTSRTPSTRKSKRIKKS